MTDIVIETCLGQDSLSRLKKWAGSRPITLVCDPNTYEASAKEWEAAMDANLFQFYSPPAASFEMLKSMQSIGENQRIVAVGSGTVNDLCKYLAHERGQAYACIPTALSMNGYLSATASLEDDAHHKASYDAAPPELLLADLFVLSSAPKRLMRAGLGDSICRSTAQFDWLLSHILHGTDYDDVPYEWLKPYEAKLYDSASALEVGDHEAHRLLLETLLASGKGMAYVGSSAPASQGEHALAHAMHALFPESCEGLLHGEEIAVTTLICARIQHELLNSDALKLSDKRKLYEVHIPPEELEVTLRAAGCPTTIEELGWTTEQVQDAIAYAPSMRERPTVLNML